MCCFIYVSVFVNVRGVGFIYKMLVCNEWMWFFNFILILKNVVVLVLCLVEILCMRWLW